MSASSMWTFCISLLYKELRIFVLQNSGQNGQKIGYFVLSVCEKSLRFANNRYIITAVETEITLGREAYPLTNFFEEKVSPVAALRNATNRSILAAEGPTDTGEEKFDPAAA